MGLFKKLFNKKEEAGQSSAPQFHSLVIKNIIRETAKAVSLQFDKPAQGFDYIPGQYMTFRAIIDGSEQRRAYSLSSVPGDDFLQVTVKETPDGFFSKYVNNDLKSGDTIDVMPPMGKFSHSANAQATNHYVAAAGGSGITPIFSILQTVLHQEPQSKFTLFYGNRTREDIIFAEKLQALESKFSNSFKLIHILSDEEVPEFTPYTGFVTEDMVRGFAGTYFEAPMVASFFLCGPGPMIDTIQASLEGLGVAPNNIKTELFTAPLESETVLISANDEIVTPASIQIQYDGKQETVEYTNPKKSVLDMALDNGIKVPFSCLNGVCSTCSAKLKKGTVKMDQNFALEEEDLNDGYILTCQSHPTSSEIEVDYDDNRI